jgi:hypothetical protein
LMNNILDCNQEALCSWNAAFLQLYSCSFQ